MTILPLNPAENASLEALMGFLTECQKAARKSGRAQLVSITMPVDALDPLAVLESIFEPSERHFYVERPAESFAVAGAEAVAVFTGSGPNRFADAQRFIDETLANTIAVGDQSLPFAGPHFFTAFSFLDETEPGEAFEAVSVFVPRWQVATVRGATIAVANLAIDAATPLEPVAERVWRARRKFGSFDYSAPAFDPGTAELGRVAWREVGEEGQFVRAVDAALQQIAAREYQKIVLARAKDITAEKAFYPLRVLNGLRQRFPDCYAFSVANGRGQSVIGASPERLLRLGAGRLTTEALAGSARRGATASEDAALASGLLRSEKDLAEHRWVLDSIMRRLEPLGVKARHPDKPTLKRLANVQHLHMPIEADMPEDVRALELVATLHPTPAVGGTPREASVRCIRNLEGFPRGLYAGALGWVNARGEADFFVGLRSALIDGSRARLYAGAGIVAGSIARDEQQETELKFNALQQAFLESHRE